MKRFAYILFALTTALTAGAVVKSDISCGDWLTFEAHAFDDYHFVRWSDGNTDSVRSVQVHEDATYIAYFAANCAEYANWPVVALYDWLLMLNVRAVKQMGYYPTEANVTWYRVVGEPDDMHAAFPQDDQLVTTGYYLTLARNLWGTGDYYAVVDVADAQGKLCDGLMRTVIIHYAGAHHAPHLELMPTVVRPCQQLRIKGFVPTESATVQVYSAAGQLVRTFVSNEEVVRFAAEATAGCYYVHVSSPSVQQVLKYLVTN